MNFQWNFTFILHLNYQILKCIFSLLEKHVLILVTTMTWWLQSWRKNLRHRTLSDQIRSVAQLCPTLRNPMNGSTPGLPIHHQLLEFIETHVHQVSDAIQPSHPLSPLSPPAFNLFQHQGLFQWVSSSHQMAKILELQLQHQSFRWIFRVDFL